MESESDLDSGDGVKEEAILFMSDASAEAERLIVALRTNGYLVADVALALLAGRVAVQRPALVLCDADAEGALDTLARIRGMSQQRIIPVVLLGMRDGVIAKIESSLVQAVFARPVNVTELVSTVERLVGSPRANVSISPSARPGKPVGSSHPPKRASVSERPARPDANGAPLISLPPDLAGEGGAPRESAEAPIVELAQDLQQRLQAAERRLAEGAPASGSARDDHDADLEPEGSLPPEVLGALDGPVDEDDSGEDSGVSEGAADGTGGLSPSKSMTRGHTQIGSTIGGTSAGGTGIGTSAASLGTDMISMSGDADALAGAAARPGLTRVSSEPPPPSVEELDEQRRARQQASTPKPPKPNPDADAEPETQPPRRLSVAPPTVFEPAAVPPSAEEREAPAGATVVHTSKLAEEERPVDPGAADRERGTERPGEVNESLSPAGAEADRAPVAPTALGVGGAITTLAHAIRTRFTGAMAFEVDEGIRRVVLREGDFVTAASGVHAESLVAFLASRGDLPEEVVRQAHKLPPFGRRAGAALIAHGHLAQDDLWPVLRAHAEWIIGRIARIERGRALVEEQVLNRLQDEPAVFGGATGAEVLVEVVRRVVPPEEAMALLGGATASLTAGPAKSLLGECALPPMETELAQHAANSAIEELTRNVPDASFVPVLYALVALGILSTGSATAGRGEAVVPAKEHDEIDDQALRERIVTRKALIDEGDYFAVLGVARNATGYDIRRAYTTLRREFEPSRVLTVATADLSDAVSEIVDVLEEAYEILSDQRRRDRYRRAIEAVP